MLPSFEFSPPTVSKLGPDNSFHTVPTLYYFNALAPLIA